MKDYCPVGPLFTLRIPRDEFDQLGTWLKDRLRYADPARITPEMAAVFCVFAAEWWRRNHEKGAWKWLSIQQALDIERVHQGHLRTWTEVGLRKLGRKPVQINRATMYLMSLAIEGGFPLKMVKRQGTHLHELFSALFDDLERTSDRAPTADGVAKLAEQRDGCLPRSLRQPPVFQLVGLLVAYLWPLVQEVAGEQRPLAWLDAHHPDWRAGLPVELEDEDARAFLEGLIAVGSDTLTGGGAFEITCHLAQDPETESWRLIRSFRAPDRVSQQDAEILLEAHAASPAVRVRMIGAGADAVAAVLRRDRGEFFTELIPGARVRDDDGPVDAELMSKDVPASLVSVSGGMSLGPLPWTFRRRHDRWELVGTASCRVADEVVWVAVPPDATVSPVQVVAPVGEIAGLGRKLVEVHGTVEIRTATEGMVQITCGADKVEAVPKFVWTGSRHPELSARRPVFRGWPTLCEEQARGNRRPVEWQVRGRNGWERPGAVYGDVLVRRVDRDGRLLLLQWLQVLPEDLSVQLDVGMAGGRVTVRSAHLRDAGIASGDELQVDRQRVAGGVALDVRLIGRERPVVVDLFLDLGSKGITVQAPCPVEIFEFLGRDGRPLPTGHTLHVGEIGGVRAQVTEPRQREHFVEAALAGTHVKRTFAIPAINDHVSVRDLRSVQDEVRALLAQSVDLDAVLELRLFTPGAPAGRSRQVRIQRYDWAPERDFETGDVVVPDTVAADDVVVEARPFAAILDKETLPRVRTLRLSGHRWMFDPTRRAPGGWLITMRDGVWFRARPTLWTVDGEVDADGLIGAIQGPSKDARRAAFRAAFDPLVSNLDHPDWVVLDQLLEACADLPAATFDGIVQLLDHPVLPLVLARLSWLEDRRRIEILDSIGALPTCYMLLPHAHWLTAFDVLFESEDDAELGLASMKLAVDALERVIPLDDYASLWCDRRGIQPPRWLRGDYRMARLPVGREFALETRSELVAALMHRHQVGQWPSPNVPEPPPELRVAHASLHEHVDRIAQAPAVAAAFAVNGRGAPPFELASAVKEAHDFDPIYFRECWSRTLAVALAKENP